MKITLEKEELLIGVNTVYKAVPRQSTMTVLLCFLIEASGGTIKITGNDTELGIEHIMDGTIEEAGKIAIDARLFFEVVKKLPDNLVTIDATDPIQVKIICEKSGFTLPLKAADEYTYLPYVEKEDEICMSQLTLKEMIRQTLFAASVSDTNKVMKGELFEISENKLCMAALDGYRVAIRMVDLGRVYEKKKVIIPSKSMAEVGRILEGDMEKTVRIYLTENHALFEIGKTRIVTRLIDGEFFRIDYMFVLNYETKITIEKQKLMLSMERASLFVNESEKKPIILTIQDEIMKMKIVSYAGKLEEEAAIIKDGKDLKIAMNPIFVNDALKAIDDDEITIYMTNPKAPCFIRDVEGTYIYVILPVNFTDME